MVGTIILLRSRSQAESVPPRLALASLPLNLGDWQGKDLTISDDVRQILGEGDFLDRLYKRSPEELWVDLFIAYFPTQRTGSTIHSPQNCLPGSGWVPVETSHIELPRPGGQTMTINRYVIAKGADRQLVLYWYQSHGRVIASEYWAKFYLVADTMRLNRSDGALVRLITSVAPNESIEGTQNRVVKFEQRLMPILGSYIPN